MIRWICILFCAFTLVGCGRGNILGQSPAGQVKSVAAASEMPPSTSVTVRGTMVEKCPIAGCWFILQDKTGTVKVDTKAGEFVVLTVPLQKKILVSGVVVSNGAEVMIQATGLRY
jgi:uncharacterized protein YdeI (BOF family)